jgi:hypothetical protein
VNNLLLTGLGGIFLVLHLALLVVAVWAFIDAVTRSDAAFRAADKRTKQFWLIVLGVAILVTFVGFLAIIGLIAALVYLLDVRPAVRAMSGRGGSNGPYGPW